MSKISKNKMQLDTLKYSGIILPDTLSAGVHKAANSWAPFRADLAGSPRADIGKTAVVPGSFSLCVSMHNMLYFLFELLK